MRGNDVLDSETVILPHINREVREGRGMGPTKVRRNDVSDEKNVISPHIGREAGSRGPARRPPKTGAPRGAAYSIAAANHLVSEVGCVMPVPTTTAQAPASMAVLASAGVWTWPSQMIG